MATLKFDPDLEDNKGIGIACFYIGNRNMSLYNLSMSQMQLQNISTASQTVVKGGAYIDIVYIPD